MSNETQKVIYAVPSNLKLTGIEDEKADVAFGALMRSDNAIEIEEAAAYLLEQSVDNVKLMIRLHTSVIYTMFVRWPMLSQSDVRKAVELVFADVDGPDREDYIRESNACIEELLEGCVNPFPSPDLTEEGLAYIRDYVAGGEEGVRLEVMMKLAAGEADAEDIARLDTILNDDDRRYIGLGLRNMGRTDPFNVLTEDEVARYTNLA